MTDNTGTHNEEDFFGLSPRDYIDQIAPPEATAYAKRMLLSEGLLTESSPEFVTELAFLVWDLEQLRANAMYNSLSDVDKIEYMRLIDNATSAEEATEFVNSRTKDMEAIIKHAWDSFRYKWENIK